METIKAHRHQMIRTAILQRPEAIQDVTVKLWERLSAELTTIIGEGGFQSLYARCIHLTGATFPWIECGHPSQPTDSRFAGLKMSLEGREFDEASEASIALLVTFIDILTLLIGEQLTAGILQSAWGDDAMVNAAKELR